MTRKKGIALIICLTLIISMALPGTLAVSTDQAGTNDNVTFTSGNDQTPPSAPEGQQQGQQEEQHEPENPIIPENPTEGEQACTECGKTGTHAETCSQYVAPAEPEKTCTCGSTDGTHAENCPLYIAPVCTCDPKPGEGEPHEENCPAYNDLMPVKGTTAAAEGTGSSVTEPAAGHIHIKINVFCVDDNNIETPQPGVPVEVRRYLDPSYYGNGEELPDWKDGLSMFSRTSDERGVVEIEVPYTVVKDPNNAANDTAYLGNGETNDNNHVVYQRAAEDGDNLIRFAIVLAEKSGYELNDVSEKIRNWKQGINAGEVQGEESDDFVFTSGILNGDGQENAGAYVEFDLYVKKTAPTKEPTTEEPTEEQVNIVYESVGPADAMNFGSVDRASETVMVKSGTAVGSTPTANPGFKFVGWYKDKECMQAVDAAWIANNKITPKQTKDLGSGVLGYEGATYYAKFDYDVANLTINKTGCQDIDENQSFIFDVTGPNGYSKRVVIKGNGSVTITGLKVGTYTVTEVKSWSWRYSPESPSVTHEINPTQPYTVFDFTNSREQGKWLSGNAYSKFENK